MVITMMMMMMMMMMEKERESDMPIQLIHQYPLQRHLEKKQFFRIPLLLLLHFPLPLSLGSPSP